MYSIYLISVGHIEATAGKVLECIALGPTHKTRHQRTLYSTSASQYTSDRPVLDLYPPRREERLS